MAPPPPRNPAPVPSANPDVMKRIGATLPNAPGLQNPDEKFVWMPGKPMRVPRNYRMGKGDRYTGRGMPSYETKEIMDSTGMPWSGVGKTPIDEIINWFYDDKKRAEILAYMKKKGYDLTNINDAFELWNAAVNHASDAFMSSGEKLRKSPWDILDILAPSKEEIAARTPSPWRGDTYAETTTAVNMADMAPETARTIITKALRDALGRGPTEEEIKDFTSRAAAIIHENPQVQENTTQYAWDPMATPEGGAYRPVGTLSRQVGPSAEEVSNMVESEATETGQNNPEAGAYEAATEGMNAFFQAIMSPTG